MTQINLLPWREELSQQKNNIFYTLWGATALSMILIVLFIHAIVNHWINNQNANNEFLEDQIRSYEGEISQIKTLKDEKQKLISRINIIQALQANRSSIVVILDNLVRVVPDGIYLTQVSRKGEILSLEGKAESYQNISEFLKKIKTLKWVKNADLSESKLNDASGSQALLGSQEVGFRMELTQNASVEGG
ncbi:MAG: hypothetical protein JWM09_386 [Francisellaceae bacterium]|nr:hypothetical protein [Francisellaceae bacterium]